MQNDQKFCYMCYNAKLDDTGELNDKNDFSSITVGNSASGYRIMISSGYGKSLRIEQWILCKDANTWALAGEYYPKYCPNCGREITEYNENN